MLKKSATLVFFALLFCINVHGQTIEWVRDIKAGQQIAKEKGKPIMYDFSASWCGPCMAMEREFWPRAEVVQLSRAFVCIKVNFDNEKTLAGKYGVSAIPNVVFTDPWGRGLSYQLGFGNGSSSEIFEKIKLLPKDFSSILDAGNILEADGKNLDALYKMAVFYQDRKLFWLASDLMKQILKLETDPAKRENPRMNLAFNLIRMNEPGDAISQFESLQKEYPNSPQNSIFLYGILLANIKKNKLDKAEKYLGELKSRFPDSKLIPEAEQAIFNFKVKKK